MDLERLRKPGQQNLRRLRELPPSLYEIPATGGTPRLLLRAGVERGRPGEYSGGIYAARFLPAEAGPRVLVFATGTQRDPVLQVLDLTTRKGQRLGRGTLPVYSPTGHLIYQEGGHDYSLWAMPFPLKKRAPTGRPFKIAAHGRHPTIAEDGTLTYVDAPATSWRLAWLERQGRHLGYATGLIPAFWQPELSPTTGSSFPTWIPTATIRTCGFMTSRTTPATG